MNLSKKILIILLLLPITSYAVTYTCNIIKKLGFEHEYSKEELDKHPFFTLLETSEDITYISRCIYFNKKLQCKKMLVDKIVHDNNVNITKFYVFEPQYNFQLFHNLSGIEDNGRGDISFEKCTVN
ncbi:hypothetical protein [Legionella sp. PC997]|uniref:hypothetical protein n=1 Tax=Legionella sp. PC997 TaxID=2755562 RepID=UPI0015FE689C|nr:hypothetical protein [Legionella sp. PC997]QMT62073.1 hypothetical protein HBNCFIEN_03481 [Legionella sp. PC997]